MPDEEHIIRVQGGSKSWNEWRENHPDVTPDLEGANLARVKLEGASLNRANFRKAYLHEANLLAADLTLANLAEANLREACLRTTDLRAADLSDADLRGADLRKANLSRAILRGTNLEGADLREAELPATELSGANLGKADLRGVNLNGASLAGADLKGIDLSDAHLNRTNLQRANLTVANLKKAELRGADLSQANLSGANLTEVDLRDAVLECALLLSTDLTDSNLIGCHVYGISTWELKLEGAKQSNLFITRASQSAIQVDNLEVAQFMYLLLNNQKVRYFIDTITSKVVLILGRFTQERKIVLDAIRDELRRRDYLPVLFDFDPTSSHTTMDTVSTLAHMSRFIIADLTDAKSILGELERITTTLQLVPVQLILEVSASISPMGDSLLCRQSVLKPHFYATKEQLIASLSTVIAPAVAKSHEFRERLAEIRRQFLPWQNPTCQE
jgi:uncharacterized protein YjbI with pentapeptide repeats